MDAISSLATCSLSPPALIAAAAYLRVSASAGLLSRLCASPRSPRGDRYNSRGQRPRKTSPFAPTLPGSNPGTPHRSCRPRPRAVGPRWGPGSGRRAFRGRCPRLLSCAPAGHEAARCWCDCDYLPPSTVIRTIDCGRDAMSPLTSSRRKSAWRNSTTCTMSNCPGL
jgi:hypothetical protein